MENPERYLRFVREAERLKDTLRSAHTSQGRHESTAEHSWRLALLALALAGERPGLDSERVLGMCLIHDLGEAYEGDIPAVEQTDPAAKAAAERSAVDRLTALLPEAAARRIRSLWEEYEECRTPEARWVKALDKIRALRAMIREQGLGTIVEVDGGISARNAREVFDAGADALVAGSAVFGAEDPEAEIARILAV